MDIQVGDKVTFKSIKTGEIITLVVSGNGLKKDLLNKNYAEILKIERPKYEVVEEKKELLTEEEREFLKLYIKIIEGLNNGKVDRIIRREEDIFIVLQTGLTYKIEIGIKFGNMQVNKEYTLKELGLEEN